jgi:MFS family permease
MEGKLRTDQHNLHDTDLPQSAYMLMACSFQLFIGRLYTFYSAKTVFLACIFLFEVGSAICGAAPNSPVFIVGRAIAGLGAAGIFGGAIVLIVFVVPLHKRPVFVSLNGAIFGISSVIGPC